MGGWAEHRSGSDQRLCGGGASLSLPPDCNAPPPTPAQTLTSDRQIVVGLTITRVPVRVLIPVSCVVTALSSVLFAIRQPDWPYWRADLWAFLFSACATDA